eukprot:FR744087.1.p2 GENE.FR744087.1~~FR744087.1.p2  ORF type:complete len:127 (+),score=32.12 FR744087.1:289-669(+)
MSRVSEQGLPVACSIFRETICECKKRTPRHCPAEAVHLGEKEPRSVASPATTAPPVLPTGPPKKTALLRYESTRFISGLADVGLIRLGLWSLMLDEEGFIFGKKGMKYIGVMVLKKKKKKKKKKQA